MILFYCLLGELIKKTIRVFLSAKFRYKKTYQTQNFMHLVRDANYEITNFLCA